MKVGRCVYNPLSKLVRRIKQIMMTNLFIAYGVMMIPIGFALFGMYFLDPSHNYWLWIFAILSWAVGFIALLIAMKRANEEDERTKTKNKKEEERHQDLLNEIKGFREDLKKR